MFGGKVRVVALVGLGMLSAGIEAQTSVQSTTVQAVPAWVTAAGDRKQFEVASVRPGAPGSALTSQLLIASSENAPESRFFRANAPLLGYIIYAYKITNFNQVQKLWQQLPEWAQKDPFTIAASAASTPTQDELRIMLQSLLEDRFKLSTHFESKTGMVNALMLDSAGQIEPQIRLHPQGKACVNRTSEPVSATPDNLHAYCGIDIWRVDKRLHLRLINVPMDEVASYFDGIGGALGGLDGRPTVNQTGLAGKYDVDMEFVKDEESSSSNSVLDPVDGLTFSGALKKQLGMKLVKREGTVQLFMIDRLEKPIPQD